MIRIPAWNTYSFKLHGNIVQKEYQLRSSFDTRQILIWVKAYVFETNASGN